MHIVQIFLIVMTLLTITMTAISHPILKVPTVSMALRDWAKVWTWIPFTFGILMSHWFAPLTEFLLPWNGVGYVMVGILIVFGVDVWCLKKGIINTDLKRWKHWRWPLWYVFPGMIYGLLFWPQHG